MPIRPCPTLIKRRGPTILTPPRSHTVCTFRRRPISPVFLSARFYMVRAKRPYLYTHLPVLNLFVWFVLGILVVLFFRCMAALLNPARHWGTRIKWGLVSYTTVMFLIATVVLGMGFDLESNSYINNREFPGVTDVLGPGPLGYQRFIFSGKFMAVSNSMFFLNGWLADGLLVNSLFFLCSFT